MGLITETNAKYYTGSTYYVPTSGSGGTAYVAYKGDVELYDDGGGNPAGPANYYVAVNTAADPTTFTRLAVGTYSINSSPNWLEGDPNMGSQRIDFNPAIDGANNPRIKVQLKNPALWDNYGSYSYITLEEVITNILVAYVGAGKIIANVRRTDVMFHAKRGLQEFSYDTLKSVNSIELDISPSNTSVIPQDYVNYVGVYRIDGLGIKHPIHPAQNLTSNPLEVPIQDSEGLPTHGEEGQMIQADESETWKRWQEANDNNIIGLNPNEPGFNTNANIYQQDWWNYAYGQRYGLNPVTTQNNGWFTISEREGKFMFSSNLKGQMIILDYVSDGLAYDGTSRIPKMIEEAMYMHIAYSILSTRSNVPEYIVQRFKRDRSAKLRNAKIRLSNIKLDTFIQQMRGKSKWIKH